MSLSEELRLVINRASRENASNTPDFILAEYLLDCLVAFEDATKMRDRWFGHHTEAPGNPFPSMIASETDESGPVSK